MSKRIKLEVGTELLVIGSSHFEKTLVKEIVKKVAILNNGIKIHKRTLEPLNSKFSVELYDEELYTALYHKSMISKQLERISNHTKSENFGDGGGASMVFNRLNKIIHSLGLKPF